MRSLFSIFLIAISSQLFAVNITFNLDMSNFPLTVTPEVNGSFNNWCGNCAAMNDNNGDNIWSITIDLEPGNYEYKFSYNNWEGQENLPVGSSCTNTTGQFTNRVLNVTTEVSLAPVCWGVCTSCIEPEEIDWELFWSDEFEASTLDLGIWTPEIGASGWGNNEWQFYTSNSNNVYLNNGHLYITAREENFNGANYTSARLITNNNFEFQYGKVEARIKLPIGQGIWPAFWMLGANIENVGWPQCGEIDIMEHVNNEQETHGTVHWNNNGSHSYVGSSLPLNPEEFHDYGIIWDEEKIQFYVDDIFYYQFTFSSSNNSEQIFTKPFFLLLNVAVGGNWPGYPDNTTVFPATMEVDYVRVYQPATPISISESKTFEPIAYPNPFQSALAIQLNEKMIGKEVLVFDQNGKLVHQSKVTSSLLNIDCNAWSAGAYILSIDHYAVKVIKE